MCGLSHSPTSFMAIIQADVRESLVSGYSGSTRCIAHYHQTFLLTDSGADPLPTLERTSTSPFSFLSPSPPFCHLFPRGSSSRFPYLLPTGRKVARLTAMVWGRLNSRRVSGQSATAKRILVHFISNFPHLMKLIAACSTIEVCWKSIWKANSKSSFHVLEDKELLAFPLAQTLWRGRNPYP